eukprot:gb/GECG01004309.1/.p1 GENE.gb/GECG01004309.1/~~gb/GECG01004309.1/.p1  ORF type:complete len:402 (+),score=77.90 gb/GECG01004309.1/:1-1206(+)
MAILAPSPSERRFLVQGIDQNIRRDGRARLDFRFIDIECGLFPQANGSSRLRLEQAGTDVIACVKAEISTPAPSKPSEGLIQCDIRCSSGATSSRTREMETELRYTLDQTLLSNGALNREQLSIVPGHTCWILYVDVIVLSSGGSLADAVTLACYAALNSTLLPKINVTKVSQPHGGVEEPSSKTKVVDEHEEQLEDAMANVSMDAAEAAAASGKELVYTSGTAESSQFSYQLDVDDDPSSGWMLEATNVPVAVTLWQVNGRPVVDASLEEEACSEASIVVSMDRKGNLVSINTRSQPSGQAFHGDTSESLVFGCIHPEALEASINAAQAIAKVLFDRVDASLENAKEKNQQAMNYFVNEIKTGSNGSTLISEDSALNGVRQSLQDDDVNAIASAASKMNS